MNYEKEYKKLKADIEKAYLFAQTDSTKAVLEHILPELSESEDEKIRKELLQIAKESEDSFYMVMTPNKREHLIAWLEKQGHTDGIIEKAKTEKQRVLITETDGNANIDWDTRSLEDTRKLLEYGLQYIEKQVEQNPTNKSELKFNVGEWVVNKFGYSWHIDSFDKKYYQVSDGKGNYNYFPIVKQDEMRHWSITDAKPGDVLAFSYASINYILIYKGLHEKKFETLMSVFCFYNVEEDTYYDETDNFHAMNTGEIIIPATKEQRGLFFQKMQEAGYIFDFEKKELQKIHVIDEKASPTCNKEDEEYNGEDYGIDSLYHAQRILEKTLGKVNGYQTDDGILSHQCAITAVKKLYEHKPTECIKFNNEFENQVSHLIASVLNGEHEYNESFVKHVTQSLLSYAKKRIETHRVE